MKTVTMKLPRWLFFVVFLMPGLATALPQAKRLPANVSINGVISIPQNFRTEFVFLGSWFLELEDQDERLMQHVYSRKQDVEAFKKNGKWPDGTMLVKEQFQAETTGTENRADSFASHPQGYFVMVRDRQNRFSGNPLWGDGWGWSYFSANNPRQAKTKNYRSDCLGCHESARDSELVFSKGYPLLKQ